MGSVYKKTYPAKLPADAQILTRDVDGEPKQFARWKEDGKSYTAPLTKDGTKVLLESRTYTAKYRDGSGTVRETATGCRDVTAAKQFLANLEKRADSVRSGIRTSAEDATVDHQPVPLTEHFSDYINHLEAEGTSSLHRDNVERCLNRVAAGCRFVRLSDLNAQAFESWLNQRKNDEIGARTRNLDRASIIAFCNWCIEAKRLMENPFSKIAKANEEADPRRKRRAMTEDELVRLLDAARRRPVLDRATVRRGKNKGQAIAKLRPETLRRLEILGWERALLYKSYLLTGLRKSELASLTIGQLEFDGPVAFVVLNVADEKNREGNSIPLRSDLAADLKLWLEHLLSSAQEQAARKGQPIPAKLPATTRIFTVPDKLVRILNRDLKLAGIPKRDDRGRTLDVHALRTSFITLLSKGGVAPRTAQAAARHKDIKLTMQTYTDTKLLDVHGALDSLPGLPVVAATNGRLASKQNLHAPDFDAPENQHAPIHAPTSDKMG